MMTPARRASRARTVVARLALAALIVAGLGAGAPALAQVSDYDKVRAASGNGPRTPAPKPVVIEGVDAAEALNADINARNAEAAAPRPRR